ncbi:MAG: cytidine deaminase [Candidatus Pacebacteria bacterium]|jgi:cytidine deaminase|nr:cytidine deaminase [Candidatus Paceibacterota bacterium]
MRNIFFDELSQIQQNALLAAAEAMENAYNPYSHFYVGATLIAEDGTLISGSNVENAAYGSTICAERAAILAANAVGLRKFRGIAIIARGETFDTNTVTAPCGSCRQMLYELSQVSGGDFGFVLSTTKMDKIIITSIKELLPLAFGPLDIGIDISKYQK